MSTRGVLYTWGANEVGQLGLGHEQPNCAPEPITSIKGVQRIDCGLKHCVALTKEGIYAWGSNHQYQLGKKTQGNFVSAPLLVDSFSTAKAFRFACGSYHNICLSHKPPISKEPEDAPHDIENSKHSDDNCPHLEIVKKLKGELKRLRQELIMKGSSKRGHKYDDSESDEDDWDQDERAAMMMLPPEKKRYLAELQENGASKATLKKKIRQYIVQ